MTDWIEHDGGPQPVADDVWVDINSNLGALRGLAGWFPLSWEERGRYRILNQHLIDAARLEGIRLGLEAAAGVADHDWPDPNSPIRNLDPDTIAREAVLEQLTAEAQAQGMGYDHDDAKENTR